LFCDSSLSRRLERTEGQAAATFAESRRRLFPRSGAGWMEYAGAFAVFDGVDSPLTQCFGLGLTQPLTPEVLATVEQFFRERGAPVFVELSPHAGVAALDLLCGGGYRPVEISSVMHQPVASPAGGDSEGISVRIAGPQDLPVWTEVSARAWSHEHPELREFLAETGMIFAARDSSFCFLAEIDGQPAASAALCVHDGVALFAGAATVPDFRRRGLQAALLRARMRHAVTCGCDLAMMVAETGSNSQRNAERVGFRIAYTRTKWQLSA
jgi:GNAT superfamily N-acetyltransferase